MTLVSNDSLSVVLRHFSMELMKSLLSILRCVLLSTLYRISADAPPISSDLAGAFSDLFSVAFGVVSPPDEPRVPAAPLVLCRLRLGLEAVELLGAADFGRGS